jgi:hypothetical protein
MIQEYLEKLEALYPGHTFAWEVVFSENLEILKQLVIDGNKAALWIYPEKMYDLITGEKETAEENFNASLNSFIKFVDDYFNPPSAQSTDAIPTS